MPIKEEKNNPPIWKPTTQKYTLLQNTTLDKLEANYIFKTRKWKRLEISKEDCLLLCLRYEADLPCVLQTIKQHISMLCNLSLCRTVRKEITFVCLFCGTGKDKAITFQLIALLQHSCPPPWGGSLLSFAENCSGFTVHNTAWVH